MSYADFTLEMIERSFGIAVATGDLFPDAAPSAPPEWLTDQLRRGQELALVSEKARSEFLVAPLLLAVRQLSGNTIAIYSGQRLDVDPARGLIGECDFILARGQPVPVLHAPLLVMVEAKKNDVDAGLGQCAAQMLAARDFNAAAGRPDEAIFGCVTTGENWQFLRLDGPTLTLDRRRRYIDQVEAILGIFVAIVGPR